MKLTFKDIAKLVGLRRQSVRVYFSRRGWSLHNEDNIRQYCADREAKRKRKLTRNKS